MNENSSESEHFPAPIRKNSNQIKKIAELFQLAKSYFRRSKKLFLWKSCYTSLKSLRVCDAKYSCWFYDFIKKYENGKKHQKQNFP